MNRDALVQIFDLYSSALFRYAARLCGDVVTADHIVGDVFAKLLDQLSLGQGPKTNLRSYLFAMAYHLVVDEVRYSRRRTPLEVADVLPRDAQSLFPRLEDPIMLEQVLSAIQEELTDDQRNVVILRFLEGLNVRETAAVLGKKVSHVKVLQSRAVASIRKSIAHRNGKAGTSFLTRRSPDVAEIGETAGIEPGRQLNPDDRTGTMAAQAELSPAKR